ncbi:NAD(P)-dependent alcohol dehydrogenase [Streptomyces canus]|uniref:NAD(P)-dependent alcohol dehydrogenase n=1 Tax=Streptomyces canus TaxID=58343 RepID=UPI00037E0F03|nr:NAD(P)-dependent alcohol dehydrogenase [Streptomyces canus]
MVQAYSVERAGGPVVPREVETRPLGPLEVDVAVTHCGVCRSDITLIDDEYGYAAFPLVAGHEAVGVVTAIGEAVPEGRLSVGQRVGVGAIAGSCFACEWCLTGQHGMCPDRDDPVTRGLGGGFAQQIRAGDWRHVPAIPEAISSEHAGPLLCGGATVFAPLLRYGVKPIDRVAVVGIGGLGHLAIQFLAAWGCHVTAISATNSKEADTRRLGAHHFINSDSDELEQAKGEFDFILSTVSADLPWESYLAALRPRGIFCSVGVPPSDMSLNSVDLVSRELSVVGAIASSVHVTRQMLDFAARHEIRPQIEVFPVNRMDEALEQVRSNRIRYRAVIEL